MMRSFRWTAYLGALFLAGAMLPFLSPAAENRVQTEASIPGEARLRPANWGIWDAK